jgi:hypothetical protein
LQDGLAALFASGSLLLLVRCTPLTLAGSLALALGAYLSKETAYVLPALAVAVARATGETWPRAVREAAPHLALAAAFFAFRVLVVGVPEDYPLELSWRALLRPGAYAVWTLAGVVPGDDETLALYRTTAMAGWGLIAVAGVAAALRRRPLVTLGLLWWGAAVAFLAVQGLRFSMYYLALPAVGAALAAGGALDALVRTRPAAGRAAAVALGILAVVAGSQLIERKRAGLDPTGGYYLPQRATQTRGILDFVASERAGLAGVRRVLFVEWMDRGVVGANVTGLGWRGESPVASMLRHWFDRPDLVVLYVFPTGHPVLEQARAHRYLLQHVVSIEQAGAVTPADLVVRMQS